MSDSPKPHPFVPTKPAKVEVNYTPPKREFVRKPHLTDKPLKDNQELLELKHNLTQN